MSRSAEYFSFVGFTSLLAVLAVLHAGPPVLTGNWTLFESKVSYTVNHAFKKATGTSQTAKGKARCNARECEVLIAVPVNTFDSGDSNRDLHMLETVRAALFPVLMVRGSFASSLAEKVPFTTEFVVEFAGKSAKLPVQVMSFEQTGAKLRAVGSLMLRLSRFEIKPPSLLGFSVDDEVPVSFEAGWQK